MTRPGPKPRDPAARFDEKLILGDPNGCWLWGGTMFRTGYSSFYVNGKGVTTGHRFAYETFIAPIPEGLEIDHLCRVRSCVNPAHLEAVTRSVNQRRIPPRMECPEGHDLTGDNLLLVKRKDGYTQRECRICVRERGRIRMARWRARKQLQGSE